MNKITRGERLMERLVETSKLTKNGCAAVIAAVDPFHDTPIEHLRGWPDLESQPSVVRTVKRSITVSSTGLSHAIVINTMPILTNATNHLTPRANAVLGPISPSASTDEIFGPVVITNYNSSSNFSRGFQTGQAVLAPNAGSPSYLDAKTRLIGMGIEVHDVTAQISKQGTLTVCQYPQTTRLDQTYNVKAQVFGGTSYTQTAIAGREIVGHPQSLGDALLFAGTRQWETKDGCYSVVPFTTDENPARMPEYCQPIFLYSGSAADKVSILNTGAVALPAPFATAALEPMVFGAQKWAPMHSKAIYLTGLNAASTFTVNAIFYLETFPDLSDVEILTLARPSACYDPVALKMISCSMQSLPVGVPVDQNFLGDWFLEMVETIAPIAGGILGGAFGGPGGAALGGVAGKAIGEMAKNARGANASTGLITAPNSYGALPPLPPRPLPPSLPARDAKYELMREAMKAQQKKNKKKRRKAKKNARQNARL